MAGNLTTEMRERLNKIDQYHTPNFSSLHHFVPANRIDTDITPSIRETFAKLRESNKGQPITVMINEIS